MTRFITLALLLFAGCTTAPVAPTPEPSVAVIPSPLVSPSPVPTPAAVKIIGVTLDNPWSTAVIPGLKSLPSKPAVRIVFDEGMAAAKYVSVVKAIKPHVSMILGELLDSYFLQDCPQSCYEKRAAEYLAALPEVDVWEMGNEINGGSDDNWLGAGAWRKASAALRLAKAAGKKTAITFYLQPDQAMFEWIDKNVSDYERASIDYVFVSYYEKDNKDWNPPWQSIFDRLSAKFPAARLGIGECGDNRSEQKARANFKRYYTDLKITTPHYIGGFFNWFQGQFFGKNAFLLPELKGAMK